MVPEWHLTVQDESGNRLPGVQVEESWNNYSFWFAEGYDLRRSDENGEVVFQSRWLWSGAISRVISPALAEVGKLFHGSAGLSIHARVFDPEAKYYSNSDDMIFWYSDWDKGQPLPNTIIGTKDK